MIKMTMNKSRVGVLLAAAGLLTGGCAAVSEDEYQAALDENRTLRQQVASLDDQLAACESDNRALASNNQALSAQLAAQPEPAAQTESGFEGIEGSSIVRREGATALAIEGDLLFASGKADLRTSARASLDRIASVISNRYGSNIIRIEGYTDTDPITKSKWASNEHLSAERALAVETYLVSRGVDSDRIYSAAFGPANPMGTKSASRRVEIVVLDGR
ncbi:MAG: OmpA family protein [Planctomycetota bacterium]